MEFLARTLVFYIIPHMYIFWRIFILFSKKRFLWLLFPFFFCMGLFPYVYGLLPIGFAQTAFSFLGRCWLPVAIFLVITFVFVDCIKFCAFLLRKWFPRGLSFFTFRKRYVMLALLVGAILYAYGVYEARTLRVTSITLTTNRLPKDSDTVRIVFVSDLHIGPQTGTPMLAKTVDLMLKQKPDIIFLGGDIFDDALQGTANDIRELQRLHAPLGVYAVLGNHEAIGDHNKSIATLAKANITLLSDEKVMADPLLIIGFNDPDIWSKTGSKEYNITDILAGKRSDYYTIVLSHRPSSISQKDIGFFDLHLAGHTHGGQFIALRPLIEAMSKSVTGFSQCTTFKGTSTLFVTTGTGYSKIPVRLFTPPEIVVVDIVKENLNNNTQSVSPDKADGQIE